MRIPYTYCITHIPSGKRYYGARWAEGCHPDDLWKTYFTSSKHVQELISKDGTHSFSTQVRKIFHDVESCRIWEQRVLSKLNVTKNENWLNRNINGKFLPYGKQSTDHVTKRIEKASKTRKERGLNFISESTKQKISDATKGKSKPFSSSHMESVLNHIKSLNSLKSTCPHCGKTGQHTNMKRWHFDNCRDQSQRHS